MKKLWTYDRMMLLVSLILLGLIIAVSDWFFMVLLVVILFGFVHGYRKERREYKARSDARIVTGQTYKSLIFPPDWPNTCRLTFEDPYKIYWPFDAEPEYGSDKEQWWMWENDPELSDRMLNGGYPRSFSYCVDPE